MSVQKRIIYFLLITTIFVVSCDISTLVNTVPTSVPGSVDTIVAMTAGAAATRTAALFTETLTPSFTPLPTLIPLDTPTVTPTFIFILSSPTSIPGGVITPVTPITTTSVDYDCQLTGQTPANGSTEPAGSDFVVIWTVANTGSKLWDNNDVDFIYFSGAQLYKSKIANLPNTVESGKAISLKITFTAPQKSGTFKTVWALQRGKNIFCTMPLTIVVQ
jgi:hypothetical protein